MTQTMIAQHMQQCLSIMTCPTVSQRQRLLGEDIAGPLHVLYDFGELQASRHQIETMMHPWVLSGPATRVLANMTRDGSWSEQVLGNSLHIIIESSEPSSGMR
jgi:hypothetical protein